MVRFALHKSRVLVCVRKYLHTVHTANRTDSEKERRAEENQNCNEPGQIKIAAVVKDQSVLKSVVGRSMGANSNQCNFYTPMPICLCLCVWCVSASCDRYP